LALADLGDGNHQAATNIQHQLVATRSRLFTTNYLIDETYTLILARAGYQYAIRFLDELRKGAVSVLRITNSDERQAEQILRQYADKRFSYTDATSFAVMERVGIEAAFTFDRNFTEYGRVLVLTP